MHTMFTIALLTGGTVLAIQVLLSLIGIDKSFTDADLHISDGHSPALSGAELLSVRSIAAAAALFGATRSEEHTSELQSRENLVCRLLLEKKNNRVDA